MSLRCLIKANTLRAFPALFLVACALLLTGCPLDLNQSTLDPKGPVAQVQLDLFMVTVWVSLFIFVVVGGVLAYAVWRYRYKPGDEEKPLPKQGHGNPLVEVGLIAASIFLLVIIAIPTLEAIWYTSELPKDQPDYPQSLLGAWYSPAAENHAAADLLRLEDPADEENVLVIKATGYQWWWNFEYPQFGVKTSNEFVIPTGKVVRVELRSADVIHSFWLPKLAGKIDLVPGRLNWMWIQADEAGVYNGVCAEFCGEAHAYMKFRCEAVSDDAFADWMADMRQGQPAPGGFEAEPTPDNPDPSYSDDWLAWINATNENPENFQDDPVQRGAMLFTGKASCITCHAIKGSPYMAVQGPDLTFVGSSRTLAAGHMDNTVPGPSQEIDTARYHENMVRWIGHSEEVKPGNLMYYGEGNFASILSKLESEGNPLTRPEIEDIAAFLRTLQY